MENGKINKLTSLKNMLSKEQSLYDKNEQQQISKPLCNFGFSNQKSELTSTNEQTTLNLSSYHNQNGLFSQNFNKGINSPKQNSKQNLETVRAYYFQNEGKRQNITFTNLNSTKITLSNKQDSNSSLTSRKQNIIPTFKLNQIQSGNQISSVESFNEGQILNNVQTQNSLNKDDNNLSFLQSSDLQKSSSIKKKFNENNNSYKNLNINEFSIERKTSSNLNCHSSQFKNNQKGVLKQKLNIEQKQEDEYKINRQQSAYQVNRNQVANIDQYNKRPSTYHKNIIYDNQLDSLNQLNEKNFSQLKPRILTYQTNKKKSNENTRNGYFSPINSMNRLNITDADQLQHNTPQVNFKINDTVTYLQNILNQGLDGISSTQTQTLNYIPNKNFTKRLNKNLTQNSSPQKTTPILQEYAIQSESIIKLQNKIKEQQNKSQIKILNKNNTDQKQQNRLQKENFSNNEINSLANIEQNESISEIYNDSIGVKYRTEGNLFQKTLQDSQLNSIKTLNQQSIHFEKDRSDSKKQLQFALSVANIENSSSSPVKKLYNAFETKLKFYQRQTEKLNSLSDFIKKQNLGRSQGQINALSIQKLEDVIQFWKFLKTRIYANNNFELAFKKNRFDEKSIKIYIEIIEKITLFCLKLGQNKLNYNEIKDLLEELINILLKIKIVSSFFIIRLYTVLGKFAYKCGNIYNSIKAFIEAKRLVNQNKEFRFKMRLHKHIGYCFKLLKKFSKAKNQMIKMLTLSWVLDNKEKELSSYEELGILFYYDYEIGIAKRLHQRFCLNITEEKTSNAREQAIQNFNQHQLYLDQQKNMNEFGFKEQTENMSKQKKKTLQMNDPNDIEQLHFDDSSDEEADYCIREIIQKEIIDEEEYQQEMLKLKKNENSAKNIKLRYCKLLQERENNKEQEQIYKRIVDSQNVTENSETEKKINPNLLISHLSRNRNLKNYIETSIKEHEQLQINNYKQNLKNKTDSINNNSQSNQIINQFRLRSQTTYQPQKIDLQSPFSLINIQPSDTQEQLDTTQTSQTLFEFYVPSFIFKKVSTSLEKIKKQILLILNNIELQESQKKIKNKNNFSRKNALLFS